MLIRSLESHEYTYEDVKLTPVTSVIKEYQQNFDKELWLTVRALEMVCPNFNKYVFKSIHSYNMEILNYIIQKEKIDKADLDEAKDHWKNKWSKYNELRTEVGDVFHKKSEERTRRRKEEPCVINGVFYPVKECTSLNPTYFRSIIENYKNIEPGAYPEFMVHNMYYKIAGTMDLLFMNEDRTFYIKDYKTYANYKKTSPYSMKEPLSYLKSDTVNYCRLQLWLYAFLLEQFGYQCLGTYVTNHNKSGYQTYKYGQNRDQIKKWLDHRKAAIDGPQVLPPASWGD